MLMDTRIRHARTWARKETTMLTVLQEIAESRGSAGLAMRAAIVAGFSLLVCACNTDQQVAAAPDVPSDYRQRHPITITESDHTLQVFVGSNRGELNAMQRAEALAFGQTWRHEATGGVWSISRSVPATSVLRPRLCAPSAQSSQQAVCREMASPFGVITRRPARSANPHQLSQDSGSSRAVRPLACRYRAELEPRLFREPAGVKSRLLDATQPRRHGGQSGG